MTIAAIILASVLFYVLPCWYFMRADKQMWRNIAFHMDRHLANANR
jgi:hypothetical protein